MGGVVAVTPSGAVLLIAIGAVLVLLALLARLAAHTAFSPIPLYLLAGLVIRVRRPARPRRDRDGDRHADRRDPPALHAGPRVRRRRRRRQPALQPAGGAPGHRPQLPARLHRRSAHGPRRAARRRAGRCDLHLVVEHRGQGPRRPRAPRQPGDPGDAGDPRAGGPGDGAVPAAHGRAARRRQHLRRLRLGRGRHGAHLRRPLARAAGTAPPSAGASRTRRARSCS